ncbi:MAG: NAD(P)-dependent methylenetetrahydromethanopterin dehydrogenase [Planctomycetaceae bacterium]
MKRILIQLDTDPLPSSFDRVVAVDAGADEIFSYGGVTPENVEPLVHGAMFTRKPADLKHTAVFIGGGVVSAGEAVRQKVIETFFGPVRVSVMMDSNGSNTTAAATVLAAAKHLDLRQTTALVLGGTGPVGCRAAQILLSQGSTVRLASRQLAKAQQTCQELGRSVDISRLTPHAWSKDDEIASASAGVQLIISSGAAGAELMSEARLQTVAGLKVAIDLNAVPPAGLGGIDVMDKAALRHGIICYGAIGVGGTKMKIHSAALKQLFESNDKVLDTNAIYEIGKGLG